MSAFELEISDEEQRGGFDLGAPDDESFKLESLDEYPGTLPDFGIEEEPVIPISEESSNEPEAEPEEELVENSEETDIDFPDGDELEDDSDEEAFEDSDDEVDPETYDEEDQSETSEDAGDEEGFSGEFEDDEIEIEEEEEPQASESNDEIEELSPEEIAELGGEQITSEEKELGDVDPELQTLLNSELERSKEIKEKKAESLPDDFDVEPEYEDFVPVEEKESDLEEIDITSMEADKLSTFGIDKSQSNEESPSDNNQNDKKKKKRKLLPLILVTVFVLFASVISLGIFKVVDIPYLSTLLDEEIVDSTQTDTVEVIKEIVKEEPKIDTSKVEHEVAKVDTVVKDTVIEEVMEETVVAEAPKVIVPKEKRIVDNRPKKKPTKIIAKRNSSKEEKPNKIRVPKSDRKPESDIGLFTIQIYASPSKEDATEWLNKLQSENIGDAFISEQLVRDEIWYRVRFGNFKTKQEAQAAALKLGYSQTWIDRVK